MTSLEDALLDDRYWLSRAKTMLDGAISCREEAASKIIAGVAWFWTVYSTVVIASLAVGDQTSLPLALALTAPAVVLMLAYLLALRVIYPVDVQFDPRSPSDIEGAYSVTLRQKRKYLRTAVVFTCLAGLTVVVAIVVAALSPGPS